MRRGKRLFGPRNLSIRPTADRIRESIFNIISQQVTGAVVLDLFAGTGAMGLEALSRGAARAVFIDNHPVALALVKKNIAACQWADRARGIRWDIRRNLNCIHSGPARYDLVFIDPPYALRLAAETLKHLEQTRMLANGSIIIVEHDRSEIIENAAPSFICEDERAYGKTLVTFFRYMV